MALAKTKSAEMPAPLLSIIVISYNTADLTIGALRSVYDTAGDLDFELLVYDNASSDGSAEKIAAAFPAARYPNLSLVALNENLGFARANNLAAKDARGEFILLLNPDTVVLDNALQAMVAFARRRPEAGIWGARNYRGDGELDPGSVWGRMSLWSLTSYATGLQWLFQRSEFFNPEGYGAWDRGTEREVDIVTGCFLVIRADLWRDLGGFDSRFFMYAEEADLCLRARALGARPRFTPDAAIIHFIGASEKVRSDRVVRLFAGKLTLAEKHLPRWQLPLARTALRLAVLARLSGHRLMALGSSRERHRIAAAEWAAVWARRKVWLAGYDAPKSARGDAAGASAG